MRIPDAQVSAAGHRILWLKVLLEYHANTLYLRSMPGTLVSLVFGKADFMVFIEHFVSRNGTAHPDPPAA